MQRSTFGRPIPMVCTILLAWSLGAAAETLTVKYPALRIVRENYSYTDHTTGCVYGGADGGIVTVSGTGSFYFDDPLPSGALLKSIDVRASVFPDGSSSFVQAFLDAYNDPNRLIGSVPLPVSTDLCPSFQSVVISGTTTATGIPNYRYKSENFVTMIVTPYITWYFEFIELTFHYSMPVATFDLTTPEKGPHT